MGWMLAIGEKRTLHPFTPATSVIDSPVKVDQSCWWKVAPNRPCWPQ